MLLYFVSSLPSSNKLNVKLRACSVLLLVFFKNNITRREKDNNEIQKKEKKRELYGARRTMGLPRRHEGPTKARGRPAGRTITTGPVFSLSGRQAGRLRPIRLTGSPTQHTHDFHFIFSLRNFSLQFCCHSSSCPVLYYAPVSCNGFSMAGINAAQSCW